MSTERILGPVRDGLVDGAGFPEALHLFGVQLYHAGHAELGVCHFEVDVVVLKRHPEVAALGGHAGVGGAGVLGEHLEGAFVQVGRQLGEQLGREVHLELVPFVGFDPAVAGFGLGIGKGQVGLDIVDRLAVHHVGADYV